MGRKSALSSLFAATAVLVAGCDSAVGVEDAGARHEAGTSAAVTTTTTPVAAAPPAGSPTAATSSAPAGPVRLKPDDASGLTFEWRESGSGRTGTITIDVFAANGRRVQTITEPDAELRQTKPALKDTDGDGRDELIVPVEFGAYWTRNAVYRSAGDGQDFLRAGAITGDGFNPTADGYTLVAKRNPPTQWNYTFLVYENNELVPVIEVSERALAVDASNRITEKECVIEQLPSLAATGYATREAARLHFCAEIAATR
ncbi:hypothetical protein [Nocardia yamanashiensis]|uniref:hypothetical protein n=1 Tax=Nocardia yamanashiensis TaxID=209247 RepID=UPI0012FDA7F9|nr:hypothetical protein [Nocardia yamanashiensis]